LLVFASFATTAMMQKDGNNEEKKGANVIATSVHYSFANEKISR